jgi:DNA-binding FadR family transcriptional regulator
MALNQATFEELWQVSVVLEPLAAALASVTIGDDHLAALRDNLARTRQAVERDISPVDLDIEFHSIVAAATRNTVLLLAREPVALLLYPSYLAFRPKVPQSDGRLLAAHEQIIRALETHNAAEAEAWMRKHIVDFRRGWELADFPVDAPIIDFDGNRPAG